ncbi:hypothetical protein H9M94_00495 [Mycoplasma sp. Pen4]|uniref:hypothetical protein n=1 Tax=Mycoplasma sp. Pen4 TaxID=640330 RepID=UPI001654A3EF|nr:hypothetical protein [Mycoplasma sp. Pen4]QNM93742.1 hypothetical protein H9M94_00495 [Mycoplasma sp. Pen4]
MTSTIIKYFANQDETSSTVVNKLSDTSNAFALSNYILGSFMIVFFLAIIMLQSSFINRTKMIINQFSDNPSFFKKVKLPHLLMKYWKIKFIVFFISVALFYLMATSTIVTSVLYSYWALKVDGVNSSSSIFSTTLSKIGITIVFSILSMFFTYYIYKISYSIYIWNKQMNFWEITETGDQISYLEFLETKIPDKEWPIKQNLDNAIIKSKSTSLTFRISRLSRVARSKQLPKDIKIGRTLLETFFDYDKATVNDKNFTDTDFVFNLITLLKRLEKQVK